MHLSFSYGIVYGSSSGDAEVVSTVRQLVQSMPGGKPTEAGWAPGRVWHRKPRFKHLGRECGGQVLGWVKQQLTGY